MTTKTKTFPLALRNGRTTTATITIHEDGDVYFKAWGLEQTAYVAAMSMQNGQCDYGVMLSNVDAPVQTHVFWYNDRRLTAPDCTPLARASGRTRVEVAPGQHHAGALLDVAMSAVAGFIEPNATDASRYELAHALAEAFAELR